MPDAAYYRAWRKAHPGYARRPRARTKEQRRAERLRAKARKSRAYVEPTVNLDPTIAWAREHAAIIIPPDRRTSLSDQLYEEVVSELLLAVAMNRQDPSIAAKDWLLQERLWRKRHVTGAIDHASSP